MAPVHAQHHKPNPLLPAVNLQLEADSWCLVGVGMLLLFPFILHYSNTLPGFSFALCRLICFRLSMLEDGRDVVILIAMHLFDLSFKEKGYLVYF